MMTRMLQAGSGAVRLLLPLEARYSPGVRFPGRRADSLWARLNVPLVAALVATALSALVYVGTLQGLLSVPGLAQLELTSVDARFQLRGQRAPRRDDIVIVGLDNKTRREAVQVFQTRRGLADLFKVLGEYQPKVIGADMFFGSPESPLRPQVIEQVQGARAALSALQPPAPEVKQALDAFDSVLYETRSDEILARAIAGSRKVLLGIMFHFPESGRPPPDAGRREPPGIAGARYSEYVATDGPRSQRPPGAYAVTRSLSHIAKGALGAGAVNVLPDDDGSVRRVYGVAAYGGRYYMPLGLVMALHELQTEATYVAGETRIRVGDRSLPVSARGVALLNHLGPRHTFTHVSAADVLARRVPAEALRDKLVLVGHTDAARDKVITPFDPQLDGVEIHATLLHNVLHGELLRRSGPSTTLLTILLLGALLTVLQLQRVRRRRAWVGGAVAPVIIAGYLVVAHVLFAGSGLVIDVAAPVLACVFITLTSLVAAVATEGREKAQLRSAFSQYVNDVVVDRIVADPTRASLGGERRDLTVLFSDIRGFSSFSEQLEPEVLSAYLNEYLTPMTELVMDEGGMLDKYIGDAIMAVYGAPIDLEDHAQRACGSALHMLRALEPLNRHWRERELPDIAIGIGINSGPMSVGNMGSEARFSYTVLGDTVNLGARLEGLTKQYRVSVLVGEETEARARDAFRFRELDWVRVKGRASTTRIYELLGPREANGATGERATQLSADDLDLYQRALDDYRRRDWDSAAQNFAGFLERHPDDGPARMMTERIATLREHPPGADWDGVYDQVSK